MAKAILKSWVGKVIIIAILLSIIMSVVYYNTQTTVTIKVKSKERITDGSGQNMTSKYLVYADGEVFEDTDSWLFMKFGSSDIYNNFETGKTYTVKVVGWRVPFLSMYRNIIEIK